MKIPRILIIDDAADFGKELGDFLRKRLKSEVIILTDGLKASKLLDKEFFDVILTDYMMSGASGLAILKKAKEKDPQGIVVVITGTENTSATKKVESLGGIFVPKPVGLQLIQRLVEQALEKKGGYDFKC